MVVKSSILEIKMLEVIQLLVHMVGGQMTGDKNCGKLKTMVLWKTEPEVHRNRLLSIRGVVLMTRASHIRLVINIEFLGFYLVLLILPVYNTIYLTEEYSPLCLLHTTGSDREHEFSTYC